MGLSMPRNSTNVREPSPLDPWPAPAGAASCAPAVVLASWALFVAFGSVELVFTRLEAEAYAALVLFVAGFALAAARIDADAAAVVARMRRPLALALVLDALLVALPLALADAAWRWTTFPGAMLLLLVLPLALVLHAEAWRRPRLRTAPGASPVARRAAT